MCLGGAAVDMKGFDKMCHPLNGMLMNENTLKKLESYDSHKAGNHNALATVLTWNWATSSVPNTRTGLLMPFALQLCV